jgi:hypothetical protein
MIKIPLDALTLAGAERLAARIERFWRGKPGSGTD